MIPFQMWTDIRKAINSRQLSDFPRHCLILQCHWLDVFFCFSLKCVSCEGNVLFFTRLPSAMHIIHFHAVSERLAVDVKRASIFGENTTCPYTLSSVTGSGHVKYKMNFHMTQFRHPGNFRNVLIVWALLIWQGISSATQWKSNSLVHSTFFCQSV